MNKKKVNEQSVKVAATRPKDDMEIDLPKGEVYIYSGQRLNFTEHMKGQILKDMEGRKDAHYSASKEFLSLAWPKIDPDELVLAERKKFSGTRLRYK